MPQTILGFEHIFGDDVVLGNMTVVANGNPPVTALLPSGVV